MPTHRLKPEYKKEKARDFPGGPVVKTPALPLQGTRVQSLYGELGSRVPRGTPPPPPKKKKKREGHVWACIYLVLHAWKAKELGCEVLDS